MAIPLLIAGGLVAAAGAGGAGLAGASGLGKSNFNATSFGDSKHYDPNRYEFGGRAGLGDATANRFMNMGMDAQNRAAFQADYNAADRFSNLGLEARGAQGRLADLMADRAMGRVPSIAQMQADRQMRQAAAEQASAAAGARGPAALALAQQNAAANVAGLQSGISNSAQINAAQERMAAEQAAFGAYSGMRGGDINAQQQAAAQAQFQAQMNAQNRAQNDAFTQGLFQNELGVRQQQLQGNLGNQQMLSGSFGQTQDINSGRNQANANREMDFLKMGLGAAQGGVGMATQGGGGGDPKSDIRSKFGISPLSGPADATFDVMTPGAGVDVLGSLGAHGNFGTQFARSPGAGPMLSDITSKHSYGLMVSDRRAKDEARAAGQAEGLMAGMRQQMGAPSAVQGALERDPTSAALAAMKPYSYEYKPGMGPPGQNVGPMAQDMLSNPVTGTAINRDDETGLLALDRDRSLKLAMGGVGHLAQKDRMRDAQMAQLQRALAGSSMTPSEQAGLLGVR